MARTLRKIVAWIALRLFMIIGLVCVTAAVERPAYAYTDPGSGVLIWQTLMAAFVGVSFYLRRIFMRLKRRKKSSSVDDI